MSRKTSGNLRSSLFGVIVGILLEKSGYAAIVPGRGNQETVRRTKSGLIELRGMGCWHQIDCPCALSRTAPFLPPVRLIGDVKFHMSEVKKESVRNFIGVMADLQQCSQSLTDVGIIFAANGFWRESERLAFSHHIRTISYKNNPQMEPVKKLIFELESRYLDYDAVIQQSDFLSLFAQTVQGNLPAGDFAGICNLSPETVALLEALTEQVRQIRTSFFAATATGITMHFLGKEAFPEELFEHADTAECRVRLEMNLSDDKMYYLQFCHDEKQRRFYFSPPEGLQESALYGGRKDKSLYANMSINGIERSLCLRMEPDWLGALAF